MTTNLPFVDWGKGFDSTPVAKAIASRLVHNSEVLILLIKPLKIFSHQDAIYLHARKAKEPGKRYREPRYDPLLDLHRIKKVEVTETGFEFPRDYDFEKIFNRHFGVIKEEASLQSLCLTSADRRGIKYSILYVSWSI